MKVLSAAVAASTLFAGFASAAWDLTKKNNMVLYWGQNAHGFYKPTDKFQQLRLVEYCKNAHVDLISIGFVTAWNSTKGHPVVDFSNQCGKTFPDTKLLWCPEISEDIIACQKTYGKKILISLGGHADHYKGFNTAAEAVNFANTIWNMFGKGWTYYRPFGEAVVDGVDLDIEVLPATGYQHFANRMKALFATDTSKKYYLTAAPQCPNPSAHLEAALTQAPFDAIFLQFYNNPHCGANKWVKGGPQNTNSVFNYGMWHSWIAAKSKNKGLKILVALPASPGVVGSGYVDRNKAASLATEMGKRYPSSFAGVALWDASEAWYNSGFHTTIKTALNKLADSCSITSGNQTSCNTPIQSTPIHNTPIQNTPTQSSGGNVLQHGYDKLTVRTCIGYALVSLFYPISVYTHTSFLLLVCFINSFSIPQRAMHFLISFPTNLNLAMLGITS